MSVAQIPLQQGYVAIIDEADAGHVLSAGTWHAKFYRSNIYAARCLRRPDGSWTTQSMHQFLTGYSLVDHRNGDGLDNRRSNLREVTRFGNAQNSRQRSDGTSGFKGVSYYKPGRKWRARITADGGPRRSLGYYATAQEAARAYDAAARELHGEYAVLPAPGERAA